MADNPVEKKSRCRFLGFVFGRRGLWSKKCPADNSSHKSTMSSSNASTATANTANIQFTKSPCTEFNPRKLQENKVLPEPIEIQNQVQRPISKPSSNQYPNNHQLGSDGNNQPTNNQGPVQQQQARKVPREAIGLSGELESMIIDNQKAKGKNGSMVRASSSNVMLFGNLGNLKQPGASGGNQTTIQNNGYGNTGGGYEVKKTMEEERRTSVAPSPTSNNQDQSGSLCRAISTRMDPETLKIMGNEDYKNGNFAEALALYEAAIAIDPKKASYRSNKSAALTALGRILEAVFECREAIRIEPHYHRAHHRLANLYLR